MATLVLIETVSFSQDQIVISAVGTGRAMRSALLYPSVPGEVVDVSFGAEERVRKGHPLLRLDDKHQQLAVRLAEVNVKEARRLVNRLSKLAPSGYASRARLETAQAELELAILRLDQTKAALEDRVVYAPFDGVIGLTELDIGDRVTEDTLVATLDDRSLILVEFNLPEDYSGRLKVGHPVTVRPWSAADREINGLITAMGSRIDQSMRTLRAQAQIPNPDDSLRPGGSFEVTIALSGDAYPSVAEVSVLWSRDGAYLWRVRDSKAEKVFVKLVRRDRGRVLVDGPLNAGDTIVVEGVQGLRLGQIVKTEPYKSRKAGAISTRAEGNTS